MAGRERKWGVDARITLDSGARACRTMPMEETETDILPDLADAAESWIPRLEQWLRAEVWSVDALVAALLIALAAAVFFACRHALLPRLEAALGRVPAGYWARSRLQGLAAIIPAALALLFLAIANNVAAEAGASPGLAVVAAKLLTAWVVIRLLSVMIGSAAWVAALATIIWVLAALAIVGWLDPIVAAMDRARFQAGEFRLSLLGIVQGIALFVFLLWLAAFAARLLENQIGRIGISPSGRVLLGKVVYVALAAVAIMVALTSIGIDFTAIAVFAGALGVGAGFGLQKIVSNFVSGIILLLDRSIKPGDVIEIGDAYGWIEKLSGRYVAIITRDGKEYLIPNEDLITQQVINWSYTDRTVRFKIGVGISYGSDVRKAMELMLEAAKCNPRALEDPAPAVRLTGFGDSSVDLELRVWLKDPEGGTVNVMSDIRLAIWDLFHENGIEFPFPQRDIHIVSAKGLDGLKS